MTDTETPNEPTTDAEPTGDEPAAEPVEPAAEPEPEADRESADDAATIAAFNEVPDTIEEDDDSPATPPEPEPADPEAAAADDVAARVASEREWEKRSQKLDGENVRHAKRVADILEDGAGDLIPCPVCMDGIAGWIYPPEVSQLSPEAIARVRTVIGLPDYTTYRPAAFAHECPDCGGLGEVITGSHVPGKEVTTCETCKKSGWVRTTAPKGVATIDTGTGEIVTGPTVYVDDEPDAEVLHLRERGYTVIPPMQVAGA